MTRGSLSCCVVILLLQAGSSGGAGGVEAYVDGLRRITSGEFADAATALAAAVEADDESADRHLARAIALMLSKQGEAAKAHLERARRLEPKHPGVPVWAYFHAWTFGGRQRQIPQVPHGTKEPYGVRLINATTQHRNMLDQNQPALAAEAWKEAEECGKVWAWRELARPELLAAQEGDLDAMFARGEYARSLETVSRLLVASPDDVRLLAIAAGCRLALGDPWGARGLYTRALAVEPTRLDLVAGRGIAAARTGGLRTAEGDLALAAHADLQAAIAKARTLVPREGVEALAAALGRDATPAAGERLARADAATRLVPDEAFTQELSRLQGTSERDPSSVEKGVAVAAFCIRPSIEVACRLASDGSRARIRVGRADLPRAERFLLAASRLAPDHHGALTQRGLLFAAKGEKQPMIEVVEHALGLGALNYDLGKLYLDWHQEMAAALESEAAALRMPTYTYEDRADGRWRREWPPTAAALARADKLEALAKEHRRKSMIPLQRLAAAEPNTPFGRLAQAEIHRMLGDYDAAAACGEAALGIEPWHLEAREYLVDLYARLGAGEKSSLHADILDNLIEPSATRTIAPAFALLEQTRWKSALEVLDLGARKDPASGRVAALRAIVLAQAAKGGEAGGAFAVAEAIEAGRLAILAPAPAAPLDADSCALALAVGVSWSKLGDAAAGWSRLDRVIALARRIPREQWNRQLPATRLPTVYTHENDKRRTGMTVYDIYIDAELTGAKLLSQAGRDEEAARLLVDCWEVGKALPRRPPVDMVAAPIIRKLGEERASKIFPPEMMEGYRVTSRFGRGRESAEGDRTRGIDKETARKAWIEARLQEIEEDLENLAKDQTYTGMRKRQQLEEERAALLAQR